MSWLCKLLERETEGQVLQTSLCHSNTILSSVALRLRGNVENKPKPELPPVICLEGSRLNILCSVKVKYQRSLVLKLEDRVLVSERREEGFSFPGRPWQKGPLDYRKPQL